MIAPCTQPDLADCAVDAAVDAVRHPALSRRRKAFFAFVVLGAVVLVGELTARAYRVAVDQSPIVSYDSALGWRLLPNAHRTQRGEAQPYEVTINSLGLRDREPVAESSMARVFFVGDSFVFGSGGVSQGDTFCELLERQVSGVDIWNLGVPGYSTDQQLGLLRRFAGEHPPQLVVLFVYSNDFLQSFNRYASCIGRAKPRLLPDSDGHRFAAPPSATLLERLGQRSALAAAVDRITMLSPRYYQTMDDTPADSPALRLSYQKLLVAFDELARERSFELLYVYIPARDQLVESPEQTCVRAAALQVGTEYIDLATRPPLNQLSSRRLYYFASDMHLNESGHRQVAEILEPWLTTWRQSRQPRS